jgi:hypothetical protein
VPKGPFALWAQNAELGTWELVSEDGVCFMSPQILLKLRGSSCAKKLLPASVLRTISFISRLLLTVRALSKQAPRHCLAQCKATPQDSGLPNGLEREISSPPNFPLSTVDEFEQITALDVVEVEPLAPLAPSGDPQLAVMWGCWKRGPS